MCVWMCKCECVRVGGSVILGVYSRAGRGAFFNFLFFLGVMRFRGLFWRWWRSFVGSRCLF